jgi:hypothetical protein
MSDNNYQQSGHPIGEQLEGTQSNVSENQFPNGFCNSVIVIRRRNMIGTSPDWWYCVCHRYAEPRCLE